MKNVTITLDEKAAAWARSRAADSNMSLSRYVGDLLERTMRQSQEYERAMREYLSARPVKLHKRGAKYPSREELYDRPRFR